MQVFNFNILTTNLHFTLLFKYDRMQKNYHKLQSNTLLIVLNAKTVDNVT